MKNSTKISVVILAAFLLTSFAFAKTDLLASDKLFPNDTFLYVNVDDFSQLEADFKKTNIYKLFKDPAMADFTDDLTKYFKKQIDEQDDEIFKLLTDANSMPTGRVSFGLTMGVNPDKPNSDDAGFVAICEFGKNLAKAKENVDKLVKKAIEKDYTKKEEAIAGYKVVALTKNNTVKCPPDANEPNSCPSGNRFPFSEVRYCFIGDALIATVDAKRELMPSILQQIKGGTSNLAADKDFVSMMQKVKSAGGIDVYVNVKSLIAQALKKDTDGKILSQLEAVGVANVIGLAANANFSQKPGESFISKALLKTNGPKKGIFKLLDLKSKPITVPSFVGADISSYMTANWDIKLAFKELTGIVSAIAPQFAMMLNMPMPKPDGEGMMTIGDDVLAHFNDEVVFAGGFADQISKNSITNGVIALSISDRTKLEESLGVFCTMYAAGAGADIKQEFLGQTMYIFDFSALNSAAQMGDPNAPQPTNQPPAKGGFAITDGYLVCGGEADIKKAITALKGGKITNLSSRKWFRSLKTTMPAIVGLATFENNQINYGKMWKLIKEQAANSSNKIANPFAGAMTNLPPEIDVSKLPEFDKVKKYFDLSGAYMNSTEDSFYYEARCIEMPK